MHRRCEIDQLAVKADEKNIELGYLIQPQTPNFILGDVTRLRQILVNLLNNAIKFTETGEVTLSVQASLVDAEKTVSEPGNLPESLYEILFAIQDTGIGIPADRLNRLFKSFSQVDTSTTRQYGGTGLGLAISKRLSETMNGMMWVEGLPATWEEPLHHNGKPLSLINSQLVPPSTSRLWQPLLLLS